MFSVQYLVKKTRSTGILKTSFMHNIILRLGLFIIGAAVSVFIIKMCFQYEPLLGFLVGFLMAYITSKLLDLYNKK